MYVQSVRIIKYMYIDHWPFSDQFQYLANQNAFCIGQPNLLYIFNRTTINNVLVHKQMYWVRTNL